MWCYSLGGPPGCWDPGLLSCAYVPNAACSVCTACTYALLTCVLQPSARLLPRLSWLTTRSSWMSRASWRSRSCWCPTTAPCWWLTPADASPRSSVAAALALASRSLTVKRNKASAQRSAASSPGLCRQLLCACEMRPAVQLCLGCLSPGKHRW